MIVVRSRFSSACARAACICLTRASAADARARVAWICSGAVRVVCRVGLAPARPRHGPGLRAAVRRQSRSPGRGISDFAASAAARDASAAATAASNCCCGISSFATSGSSRSTSRAAFVAVASRSRSARLAGDELRFRGLDLAVGDGDARLRLLDATGCLTARRCASTPRLSARPCRRPPLPLPHRRARRAPDPRRPDSRAGRSARPRFRLRRAGCRRRRP